jgi:regulator of sigma E protease
MFYFLISLFSLSIIIILHEVGHFLLARRFGVKVEEFGLGYPPRIFSFKKNEVVYSINAIPKGLLYFSGE